MARNPVSGGIETVTYYHEPTPWFVLDYGTNPDDTLDQPLIEFVTRSAAARYRATSGGALYRRDDIRRIDTGLWECEEWMVADYA